MAFLGEVVRKVVIANDLARAEVFIKNSDPRELEPADYLTIELSVMQWGADQKIDSLKIGTLSIPRSLAD